MAVSSSSDATPSAPDSPDGVYVKLRAVRFTFDVPAAMRWVAAKYGVSRLRQLTGMVRSAVGRARLTPTDWLMYGLFRPQLTRAERDAYVSIHSGLRLNMRLSPKVRRSQHGVMADKVMMNLVLGGAGFPVPPTLALFLPGPGPRLPGIFTLHTPEALTRWLLQDAPLPVFGKPVDGSLAMGAAGVTGREGDDLILADGRRAPAAAVVDEVARHFSAGWVVQPHLRLHPDAAALAGSTVSFLRVLTLRGPAGPETLYTVFRLPAAGVMMDATTTKGPNGVALVDPVTGAILRAQSVWRMTVTPLETALSTGVPLAGRRLPFVPEACRMCEAAHALFPLHGVIGWDVALTEEGPVLVEINSNPHHSQYQRSADRGVLNPDFRPRIEAAIAETERRIARMDAEQARVAGRR